jgi:hypothetical protein
MYHIGQMVLRKCTKCHTNKVNCLSSTLQYDVNSVGELSNQSSTIYNKHCDCSDASYTLTPFNYGDKIIIEN